MDPWLAAVLLFLVLSGKSLQILAGNSKNLAGNSKMFDLKFKFFRAQTL
jgi:hypothetical protein